MNGKKGLQHDGMAWYGNNDDDDDEIVRRKKSPC